MCPYHAIKYQQAAPLSLRKETIGSRSDIENDILSLANHPGHLHDYSYFYKYKKYVKQIESIETRLAGCLTMVRQGPLFMD